MKSLTGIGQPLNKLELRFLVGGLALQAASASLQPDTNFSCTFTWTSGKTYTLTVPAANGHAAQCLADSGCWDQDFCSDVSCNGGPC
jgi:hypothetical protein